MQKARAIQEYDQNIQRQNMLNRIQKMNPAGTGNFLQGIKDFGDHARVSQAMKGKTGMPVIPEYGFQTGLEQAEEKAVTDIKTDGSADAQELAQDTEIVTKKIGFEAPISIGNVREVDSAIASIFDLKNVNVTKEKFKQAPQQPVQQQQQYQQPVAQQAPDPRAQEWAQQNTWFGKDNIMTAAALAIDAELKQEGYSTNDIEFYQEIDKRIRESFPTKFQEGNTQDVRQQDTSRPAQVVAGASRSTPNPRKVKLSKNDVNLANKWNIPLEQYAQEKMKATKSEGEYTTINTRRGG